MSEKDGGNAFPSLELVEEYNSFKEQYVQHYLPIGGMTLRDYFAAQALPSVLSREYLEERLRSAESEHCRPYEIAARWAYQMADALLAERTKSVGAEREP